MSEGWSNAALMPTEVTVCICTHSPRIDVLERVIESIATQTVAPNTFSVLIIDNASDPPIDNEILQPLIAAGIAARLVFESVPGVTRARLRGIQEADSEFILFVDDDNVLTPKYLAAGLSFAAQNPNVGCVGGKLLLPEEVRCPSWATPYLPFLGIKDLGDQPQSGISPDWQEWEPPTAGLLCRREVAGLFVNTVERDHKALSLGRQGSSNLASCEDALLTSKASDLGLATAYNPAMVLYHYIAPHRLRLAYLLRLMAGYGRSHVILARVRRGTVETPAYYASVPALLATLLYSLKKNGAKSGRFAIGMLAYHVAGWRAYRSETS